MSKTKGTIQKDVSPQAELPLFDTEHDATDAFLDRWKDSEETSDPDKGDTKPSEEVADEILEEHEETEADPDDTEEETEEAEESEDDESEEEEAEEDEETEDDEEPKKSLDDDSEVEIKVDDEVHKVSVKDLKRLWGQEAALTKKSQQVAEKRKEVEAQGTKYAAGLQHLYEKAAAKWEPYSKIDMLVASKQLDADQFAQLRQEAQKAYEDFAFLTQEVDGFVKNIEVQRQDALKAQASEAVTVLKEKIPNWSNETYDKIRVFAIEHGMEAETVNNIVDPVAIMLINKARLYDESQKITLKKKIKTPKKVVKAGTTTIADVKSDKKQESLVKLRQSGSVDDAADAFLSRWAE
jgi:hypothetical protein